MESSLLAQAQRTAPPDDAFASADHQVTAATCVTCHHGENDPEFDFAKKLPKIAHDNFSGETIKNIADQLKAAVPQITEVIDITDHAAGTNPYFQPAKKAS